MAASRTIYSAAEGKQFSASTTLAVVECPTCHVTYAIPKSFNESAEEYNSAAHPGNYWEVCCPFGHSWHYSGLTEEQDLRQRLEAQRNKSARLTAQLDQSEASRRAQKAAATRARNERDRVLKRIRAGVCPCCNRSFKNVERHMASQHPDFQIPEAGS
jgi:hypothetical protein